jgi:hypothetical protein
MSEYIGIRIYLDEEEIDKILIQHTLYRVFFKKIFFQILE